MNASSSPIQVRYVHGILMSWDMNSFLLIDKGQENKSKWQGIGGKIQYKDEPVRIDIDTGEALTTLRSWESPHFAMAREFQEETGSLVEQKRWHCFLIKEYKDAKIYNFVAFASPDEMQNIIRIGNELADSEKAGIEELLKIHNYIDVCFDREYYVHDMGMLLQCIHSETKIGMFYNLNPEGINSHDT